MRFRYSAVALTAVAAVIAPSAIFGQSRITLPAGTVIPVHLTKPLSSKTAEKGDRVRAEVGNGPEAAGLPLGTYVEGVIREAIPSRDGKPGILDIDFRKLVIPGDDGYTIDGTLASLDAKAVKRTESGRLEASGDKSKDRGKWVGIGAGAGLVLSTITKGNTIFNTVLGAGAGYLFNEFSKQKVGDVNLKEGTKFGIRLERQLSFNGDRRTTTTTRDSDGDKYYRPGNRTDKQDKTRTEPDRITGEHRDRDPEPTRQIERDPVPQSNSSDIGVLVDDREVKFSSTVKPFRKGEVTFIPLEQFAKATGYLYDYDGTTKVIKSRKSKLTLAVGSRVAMVNGNRKLLEGKAETKNGAIFVPAEFLGLALNGSVDWDSGSNTVIVTTHRDR